MPAPSASCALAHAPAGTTVREVLLVHDLETRGGDTPHTIITFGNAGGRLRSAPFWSSDRHRIVNLARGQVVEVTGVIGSWRDRRQLHVESITPLPPDLVPWDQLLPSSGDPGPWWRLVDEWRGSIRGARLAATLGLLFDDPEFRAGFQRCPASIHGHHARLGGLLQHTCEVAHLALAAVSFAPRADRDLVLAGALLHDVGKLESYRWDGLFETTIAGRALGHVVLGSRLLDRAYSRAVHPPCTREELDLLHHLILSHHGRLEFGAPVMPLTLEAEILCQADLASARAASFEEALSDADLFPGDCPISVRPVWQLDQRRIWRGRSDWG
jgi:3'-5' exoribonuclease